LSPSYASANLLAAATGLPHLRHCTLSIESKLWRNVPEALNFGATCRKRSSSSRDVRNNHGPGRITCRNKSRRPVRERTENNFALRGVRAVARRRGGNNHGQDRSGLST
jgi:hypothetical protein